MDVRDRISKIFQEVFEVTDGEVNSIKYQSIQTWDSIGHMVMISEVESAFGISIEMDDVITISNFETCVEKVGSYL